jgi:hypothetical protein
MNIMIIMTLVTYHCINILKEKFWFSGQLQNFQYTTLCILTIPFVSSLLFITDSFYVVSDSPWCTAPHGVNTWAVILFYTITWLCLGISTCLSIFTISYLWASGAVTFSTLTRGLSLTNLEHGASNESKHQTRSMVSHPSRFEIENHRHQLFPLFFTTIGWYCLFGVSLFIPRSLFRFTHFVGLSLFLQYFISYLPTAISGIVFSLVFFCNERNTIRVFESQLKETGERMTFSWEANETLALIEGLDTRNQKIGTLPEDSTSNPLNQRISVLFPAESPSIALSKQQTAALMRPSFFSFWRQGSVSVKAVGTGGGGGSGGGSGNINHNKPQMTSADDRMTSIDFRTTSADKSMI